MPIKKDVAELCKRISGEKESWKYVSSRFINVELKHTTLLVDPLWSFSSDSVLCQWIAGVHNKRIEKVLGLIGKSSSWTHRYRIDDQGEKFPFRKRIYNLYEDDAERYFRVMLEAGISLLSKSYSFSSEYEFLKNLPEEVEEIGGVKYCISRILIGDMDYVYRYLYEIKVERPKPVKEIEKLIRHLDDIEPLILHPVNNS